MELQKYDGNIYSDEWINDLQTYFNIKQISENINISKLLVDSTIKLPTGINDYEKLCNALKKDISFTVFKNTNKRKLQLLKYIPESRGGDTSQNLFQLFVNYVIMLKLMIKKNKRIIFPISNFNYFSDEFHKKMKNVNSIYELIKEFEDIVLEESNLIRNESIVALKHITTGKYLSSIKNLHYTTGSKNQPVYFYMEL
jgi:hypothetical protein